MKKVLKHAELWQKKRDQLPVNGNPDAGWSKMNSLLDKQMPVSGIVKKPFRINRIKLPKWGLHVFVGVSSVVAMYTGYKLYHSAKQHDLAIPNTQQIHRDSMAPVAKDTAPASITAKSSVSTVGGPTLSPIDQVKLNTDSATKSGHKSIDSIQLPAMLNIPVHRDSMIVPMEVAPQKAVRDSIRPVNLEKRDIQADTSNAGKKPPKKKRRAKVNVFF